MKKQIIESVVTWTKWTVFCNELSTDDERYIKELNPEIFWSDQWCYHYCLDRQLPSGKWLENIKFNNELNEAEALVL